MTRVYDLRGFQRDLLFVLAGLDGPNGQEVLAEMRDSLNDDVQAARVYTNLDELVERELVEKEATDGRTNRYELTREARRKLQVRHEWERQHLESTHD